MAAPTSSRILVIDDEESILFAMREYFGVLGYEVICAQELEEAEALLATSTYDVVIADLRLTGIAGTEGLEIVRYAKERSDKTRILVLTAYGSPEIEAEGRRRGVDRFLQKPRPLSEVAGIVRGLLEGAA